MPEPTVRSPKEKVPPRALAISVAALVVPVVTVFWLPDWTSSGLGMLIWLTALIPAFLLSYYRGLRGVAIALAGGMAVITATQLSVVTFDIADPDWTLLGVIVGVYLAVSVGIATLAEVLRRERHEAEDLALVDRVTGLPSRRHFEEALEREFAAAERGRGLAVVVFSLDYFRELNEKRGHAASEMTLKAFAKVLQANTRKENLSARIGEDEFATVLRDTDTYAAVVFAQRVLDAMRAWPLPWASQTVSSGVAQYEEGMGSYELLLAEADRALYQATVGGRDMVCVATRRERPAVDTAATPATSAPPLAGARVKPVPARIWIVDDDPAVRSVLKRVLIRDGHDLWDTGDAQEAIRRFAVATPAERPGVILVDVIMPAMTGLRMVDQIAAISHDIKIIYMSGYVQSEIRWKGSPGSVVAFLEKPIEMETLLATVQEVIGTATGGSAG